MKVFTRDYRITGDYHPAWNDYFGGLEPCVFDIEATGLDRSRCKVVLTGLLTRTDSGVRATQFLAENHYEESKVLEATADFLRQNKIGYLITYNGSAYDIPFMNARFESCFIDEQLSLFDFDLYRYLRMNSEIKEHTGSLSQKAVEDYYGILSDRGDTITGKESVLLFDQYALTGNSTIEKIILTHNREDILHLHRLMYMAHADVPCIHTALARTGLPAAGGRLSVRPSIKKSGSFSAPDYMLKITGEQLRDPVSCAYFPDTDDPVFAIYNSESRSLEITVPVSSHPDGLFLDISFLTRSNQIKDPAYAESVETLISDPDCVNDYLILSPHAVNMISRVLAEKYYLM